MRVVGGRGEWSLGGVLGDETVQEMGWPGRVRCAVLGCGWYMVVVVYVGEAVHVRASQLQDPTHRPRLKSDVMRNEYSSGSLARSGTH
jgi:hypothetical protein